jgi:spermidine synthase
MPSEESMPSRNSVSLPVICTIFFFSGFPALIYQLVWQRSLFAIYGINVESVTVVVTAFMLGLGLGSLAGGAISRLRRIPLLTVFGVVELGIGAYGYFSLEIFDAVGKATLGAGVWVTGLLTFGLVLVPTLLMGATLPILVSHLVRHTGNVGRAVGLLYFVNTLGSAAACFAVALFIMRAFGMHGAVSLAALLNMLVAGGAFLAGARRKAPPPTESAEAAAAGFSRKRFLLAAVLVGLTGFISLSYEIVWFRVHSFTTGGHAIAFAAVLGSFLLGIALGSLFARRFCTTDVKGRGLRALAGFALAATLVSFLVAPLSSWLATFLPYPFMLPLVTLAAGLLGATFPLICHYGVAPDARAGAGMSYLYLASIIGSASGSLVTGFVLLDVLSLHWTSVLLSLLGLLLAGGLVFLADTPRSARLRYLGTVAVSALLVVAVSGWLFDGLWHRLQFHEKTGEEQPFAHVLENRHGVVTVTEDRRIFGGGIYDGVFSHDLVRDRNMIVRPFAVAAFTESPREVLMIGLSSGSWAQVVVNLPGVERLTVIEINPGYIELIEREPSVKSLLANPKVVIEIDDGRRWLNRNPDRKFDLVVMNTTFHWRGHATNLLSAEFLQLLRGHLTPGGMAIYNTTDSDRVQRTACEVFPHVVRIINNVLVSDSPLVPRHERLRRALLSMRIDGEPVLDLAREPDRKALEKTLGMLDTLVEPVPPWWGMETRSSILARTEGLELITDDNMGTEWRLQHP